MSATQTLTVNVQSTGGAAVASQLNQVAGAASRAGGGIGQMGNAAGAATKSTMSLGQRVTSMGLGFGMAASGIVGLVSELQGLRMAQLGVERANYMVDVATKTVMSAEIAYGNALKKYGPSDPHTIAARKALENAYERLHIVTDRAKEKQAELNTRYMEFVATLAPNLITMVGGLAMGLGWLTGRAGGAAQGMETLAKSGRSAWLSLGLIGIVIGAGLLLYEALKNNWFGITDAFTNAGVAIGNALPFLRPLLTLIRDIGGAMGIGGPKADKWKKDLGKAWGDVIQQGQNLWKAMQDIFGKMWNASKTAIDQIGHGDWKGAFKTMGDAISGIFTTYVKPTVDKISPAFSNAFKQLMSGNVMGAIMNIGLGIQDIYYHYAAPMLNKLSPAFTTAFQKLAKGDIMGALTSLGQAISDVWNNHARPMLEKLDPAFKTAFTALGKGDIIGGLVNLGKAISDLYIKYAAPTLTKIASEFSKIFDQIAKYVAIAGANIGKALVGALVAAGAAIGKAVTDWWKNNIETALNKFITNAGPHGQKLGAAIATGIETAVSGFFSWLTSIFAPKIGTSSATTTLSEGKKVGGSILQGIETALSRFATWIGPAFAEFFKHVLVPLATAGGLLAEGILWAIEKVLGDFGTWIIQKGPGWISGAATVIAAAATTLGGQIWTGIKNGLGYIAQNLTTILNKALDDAANNIGKAAGDIGIKIWNAISHALGGAGKWLIDTLSGGKAQSATGAAGTALGGSTITAMKPQTSGGAAASGTTTTAGGTAQYGPFAILVTQTQATVVAIVQGFTRMIKDLVGVFNIMTTNIQTFVRTALINSLQLGVTNASVVVNTTFNKIQRDIQGYLNTITANIQTFVRTGLINSLQLGVTNATVAVNTGFKKMQGDAGGYLQTMINNIQTFVRTGLINSLEQGANHALSVINTDFGAMLRNVNTDMSSMVTDVGRAVSSIVSALARIGTSAREQIGSLHSLQNAIDALHGRTIPIYVVTYYSSVGGGPALGLQRSLGAGGA